MNLKLSVSEILALEQICTRNQSVTDLATALGKKKSFVSRVLRSLSEKRLAFGEKAGTKKTFSPAMMTASGQAFQKLFESRPDAKIEGWLSGSAIDVLIVLASKESVSFEDLKRESDCSQPTLYKLLKDFYAAGVATEKNGRIRLSDPLVKNFATAFADTLQLNSINGLRAYTVSIRVGKNILVRTDSLVSNQEAQLTGLSRIAPALAMIPTTRKDYYSRLGRRKVNLGPEEFFIHALLLSTLTQQSVDKTLLALYLKEEGNKLDHLKLRRLAAEYSVEGASLEAELENLNSAVSLHEKLSEYDR